MQRAMRNLRPMTRRAVLAGGTAACFLPAAALADRVIEIGWDDLIPGASDDLRQRLSDLRVVEHDDLATGFEQPEATAVTTAYNGKTVRLPGFVVPLEYDGIGVTSFILVPYVGACVHVPPPPANQLVLVETDRPHEIDGLFEAVEVTGVMRTAAEATQLAEVGYAMKAERIATFDY